MQTCPQDGHECMRCSLHRPEQPFCLRCIGGYCTIVLRLTHSETVQSQAMDAQHVARLIACHSHLHVARSLSEEGTGPGCIEAANSLSCVMLDHVQWCCFMAA